MDKEKPKVIIVGSGNTGKEALAKLLETEPDVILVSPEEAKEMGLMDKLAPQKPKEEIFKLADTRKDMFFRPPETRAERRKKARKKRR